MKKALWIVMAAALAVAVVAASAQTEVLSANAVGYIKKTLPAGGKLVAMSIPLDSMTNTSLVFGETSVASEAPVGAEVAFWDVVNQGWVAGGKSTKGWGPAQAAKVLQPGEGFFLKGDPAAVSEVEVTITGEVPDAATLPRAIPGGNALGTLANPYTTYFPFGTSAFASNASVGAEVAFWDVENQGWVAGGKSTKGWGPAQAGYVVQAGEGFFIREVAVVPTGAWTSPTRGPNRQSEQRAI